MKINRFLLIAVFLASQLGVAVQAQAASPRRMADPLKKEELLRDASIQVLLFPDNQQDSPEIGLGTLVAASGHIYLVTHNHWNPIQHWDRIQLKSAKGEPLLELNGRDFQALIAYQDPGILVLRSPLPKDRPAVKFRDARAVKSGDTVTVAFQDPNNDNNVGLLAAQVKEVGKIGKIPVFELAVLNGEDVDPYDAGGGVWFDGGFVGNLWQVKPYSPGLYKSSQMLGFRQEMIAAQSTADFLRRWVI